ncbi:MAG TPA: hypothetical protein PK264_13205 [Hyphomicrobiaceae bacterium]|nr:hypothetical protein [Hyphomicrobiaceae bacterium]
MKYSLTLALAGAGLAIMTSTAGAAPLPRTEAPAVVTSAVEPVHYGSRGGYRRYYSGSYNYYWNTRPYYYNHYYYNPRPYYYNHYYYNPRPYFYFNYGARRHRWY